MAGFWDAIAERLSAALAPLGPHGREGQALPPIAASPKGRTLIAPASSQRTVIGPKALPVIEKARRPAWDEKEWVRSQDGSRTVYTGRFRATHNGRLRLFEGRVVQGRSGIEAYIADPPPEIRKHPKGPCFAMVQAPWFYVHWHVPPRDPDNAILYVETVLDESLRGHRC